VLLKSSSNSSLRTAIAWELSTTAKASFVGSSSESQVKFDSVQRTAEASLHDASPGFNRNSKSADGTDKGSTTRTSTGPRPEAYVTAPKRPFSKIAASEAAVKSKLFKLLPRPSKRVISNPLPYSASWIVPPASGEGLCGTPL
jgi:hypothetical protein